jgi:pyruvate dehydrogenase E2 component (dihydrolipoamide acetyltransferase)
MTEIRMPRLSDSMEHGLVLQWLIEDGRPVNVGDDLVEIETDKATMTYEAEAEGVLSIVVAAGSTVAVGEVIATVGDAVATPVEASGPAPGAEASPGPEAVPSLVEAAVATGTTNANGDRSRQPLATPVARRLAAEHGVVLAELRGTGPRGRITKADVLTASGLPATPPAVPPLPQAHPPGSNAGPGAKLTRTQQLIARRMTEAKATIPHFQVQTEVDMDRALALRDEIKQIATQAEQPVPSINDLIVRACALALRASPRANGSYRESRFELHDRVNIGVAVAADDALIVPTVFDADAKSLIEIGADTRRLATRVRSGEITPPELSGATFTVSNLGMYGMTVITPVINPPQAAILGVGAIRPSLGRDPNGEIVDRALLTLTLSCDHRILYGADAAEFLSHIRELLERPLKLLL